MVKLHKYLRTGARQLHNHFVPHKGNDHQPHMLRTETVRRLIAIIFLVQVGLFTLPFISVSNFYNNFLASVLPGVLADLTNENRAAQHLNTLTVNEELNQVAQLKVNDMTVKRYFAHTSPEGKTPWYWFKQVGYNYEYGGENLAIDFTDSKDIDVAWMNSPTHRANILKNAYTELGTAIATGTYQGRETIFVAQVFAKPARVAVGSDTNVAPARAPVKTVAITTPTPVKTSKATTTVATSVAPTSTRAIVDESRVLGVATQVINFDRPVNPFIKFIAPYVTSPRHIAYTLFAIVGILVGIALLLKLIIRTDKQHPRLVTNGLVVIVIVFGLYVYNSSQTAVNSQTTTSFTSFKADAFSATASPTMDLPTGGK